MTTTPESRTPTEPTAPDEIEEAKEAKATALDRIAMIDPARSWTVLEPLRPWRNYHHGTIPLAFRKVRDEVQIVGAVCGGHRGAPVITLPEDCRPPGWTTRPIAVAGFDGIAVAVVSTAGVVTVATDRWSGGQMFYDFGIGFPVSDQLGQVVEAAKADQRPTSNDRRWGQ
ncbi:MAG: hypothetical protein ACLQPH_18675 [Acidimicrobiales bacterium]